MYIRNDTTSFTLNKATQGDTSIAIETMKFTHLDEVNELKRAHDEELKKLNDEREQAIEKARTEIQVTF